MLLVGARDVRRLLLRLALHAAGARLLADPGRARRSCRWTVLIVLLAPLAGQLLRPVRARAGSSGGGMTARSRARSSSSRGMGEHASFWSLLPAMILGGIGMSLTMTPTTAAAMASVPRDKAGVGSAVLNSMRQVGGSLGIAMMGAIVASRASPTAARGRDPAAAYPARASTTRSRSRADRARRRGRRAPRPCARSLIPSRGARRRSAIAEVASSATRAAALGSAEQAAGRARHGLPRLLREELPRRHDRGDRARGRDHRADPLPPLRLEARPLPRLPRRGLASVPRVRRAGARDEPGRLPRGDRRRLHGEAGEAPPRRPLDPGARQRPPTTR